MLLDEDGESLAVYCGRVVLPAAFQSGMRSSQVISIEFVHLGLPGPGEYAFSVLLGDDEKAVAPFSLRSAVEAGAEQEEEHE